MVLNSCLEDLEGRMRLKRMWRLVPQVGKKEERIGGGEHLSWIFGVSVKGVAGGPRAPCRYLGRQSTERAEGARPERKWKKTETSLQWQSDRLTDSDSSQKIPMILKVLVSIVSS